MNSEKSVNMYGPYVCTTNEWKDGGTSMGRMWEWLVLFMSWENVPLCER